MPYDITQLNDMLIPELIDVASGSETNGIKDEEKIKDIIQIIRGKKHE